MVNGLLLMMKRIGLVLLVLLPLWTYAQEQAVPFGAGPHGIIRCYTVENMEQMRSQYPEMSTDAEFENWLQDKMLEAERNGTAGSRMVLTIPVVVHVIHDGENVGTGMNISQAQIRSQIEVMNEDYRRKTGTAGFNTDSVGADAEIEFCLAFWDNEGLPMAEKGIDRIDRNSRGWDAPPYSPSFINSTIKPATGWDPNRYMNIWVTNIDGTILGYAQGPDGGFVTGWNTTQGPASTDGVVIGFRNFGRIGNVSFPYNRGRTLTHEAGHWLGLHHLWAPSNGPGNCNQDDFCADTPDSDDPNYGCPTSHISCGTRDMVQNYMDYSNDACMNIFTICQVGRMRTVLMNAPRRASLLTSTVCAEPTMAPSSRFGILSNDPCAGTVVFADSSLELPTSWFWTFGDGTTSTLKNPTHTYTASGTYTVTLVVNNSFGSTNFSQQITVGVSPAATVNAGPDIVACAGDPVTLNVTSSDPTATFRWSPSNGILNPASKNPVFIGTTGNTYFVTATDSTGCQATDTLLISVVPKPILNAGNNVTIQPGNTTTLNASMSKTGQFWSWTPVYGFMAAGDDSIPNPTVQPAQTVTYTLTATDIDGCVATDQVTVTVEGTNPLSINAAFQHELGLVNLPYPNPAGEKVHFSADFKKPGALEVMLFDLSGKRIQTIFQGNIQTGGFTHAWQREAHINSGLYFVVWRMEGKRIVQKLQLR